MKLKLSLIALILLTANMFAQTKESKPDSTMFRHYVNELKLVQKQISQIDTVKIKLNGIAEYLYSKALDEQKKLNSRKSEK